ncbi:hypothetical protein HanRHA438_Chr13g0629391 [Helianthus annuus]|nr:hypothetical protein HanRHA438_Chr13g0629391 [Helianthus annuus]
MRKMDSEALLLCDFEFLLPFLCTNFVVNLVEGRIEVVKVLARLFYLRGFTNRIVPRVQHVILNEHQCLDNQTGIIFLER